MPIATTSRIEPFLKLLPKLTTSLGCNSALTTKICGRLVPALYAWGTTYQILKCSTDCQYSDPKDFNDTLETTNKNKSTLIKPPIRLAKIWIPANGYVLTPSCLRNGYTIGPICSP